MLRCGRFALPLERPLLMGVLNVTPDSFSDGGRYLGRDAAVAQARRMLDEGAALIETIQAAADMTGWNLSDKARAASSTMDGR